MANAPLLAGGPRGRTGRRRDAIAADFMAQARETGGPGGRLAQAEIDGLHALAGAIAAAVDGWRNLCAPLDLAATRAFDDTRARAIVMETVFDEVLSPPAWRLLQAALNLSREAGPLGAASSEAGA